jgi:imidazolonepropionase-like amidohydrolase
VAPLARAAGLVCSASPPAPASVTPEVAWSAGAGASRPAVTAFIDVAVVPMDTERVLEHQTVLVAGGRITALGPVSKVRVPAGATQIDGRGQYLMPGLADMHAHFVDDTSRFPRCLLAYVANGVTTTR